MPDPVAAEFLSTKPRSRSRMLTVGIPAVLAVAALGGGTFLLGASDDTVQTGEVATTSTSSTTTTIVEEAVFTSSSVTVESSAAPTTQAPATTTTPTTTTLAPTTTAAPTTTIGTLPEQPSQPVAPPPDPRGAEDQIQLGGISIPKLGVDAPLLEGIRLTTLDNGPGHWPGTAMPGEVGNVVVAAHRTSHGGPFRDIDQLVAGDIVIFNIEAGEVEYTVTGTQIVNPDAIWIVDPTDTPTATLFACHPPGSVAQRIVVNLELSS
jgi:sortase A